MKAVFTRILGPIFVILALIGFPENRSNFVLPVATCILLLTIVFEGLPKARDWKGTAPALVFLTAPIAILWLMSERREGRDMSQTSISICLGLAAIGTTWLLQSKSLDKNKSSFVIFALLVWSVTFFSGRTGSADSTRGLYSFLGLSPEMTWNIIVASRKVIHVTFYSSVTLSFLYFLKGLGEQTPRALKQTFAIVLVIAVCDEWRQSLMPNRQGSIIDVTLDLGGAALICWLLFRKGLLK